MFSGLREAAAQVALTTTFTYQGQLDNNGAPVKGAYDLTFAVFDTNSAGSQVGSTLTNPAVAISNGLFTVMLDFGAGIFTGPDRWLEIGVATNGDPAFATLSPRQPITPAPEAIFSSVAGAVTDNGITSTMVAGNTVVKSLNGLRDDVTLEAGANLTLTTNGNTLSLAAVGSGGSGIWSLNGADTYYTAGGVAIGTNSLFPGYRLDVNGQAIFGVGGNGGGFVSFGTPNAETGMTINGNGSSRADLRFDGSTLKLLAGPGVGPPSAAGGISINTVGGVGVGILPTAGSGIRLDVNGAVIMRPGGGGGGVVSFGTPNAETGMTINGNGSSRADLRFDGSTLKLLAGPGNGPPANGIFINTAGNVGIGNFTPVERLTVGGISPADTKLEVNAGGDTYAALRLKNNAGSWLWQVTPSNDSPGGRLRLTDETTGHEWVSITHGGNVSVATLTIRGGADLAEPFELSKEDIAKGSVVVIDEDNPGHLKVSERPYDTRVAGIVSGANGINPGIALHQEGVNEGGQNVALSGRVYVQADAAFGAIKPGDLLTTSNTPGHAMKVTNHAKAQGAILGKAMSSLKQGKGMVLVLVTLQ